MYIKNKCPFDLKFIFINNFTIGSLFKFKDCLSLEMKFHIVYRLDCLSCFAGFIGVTTRSFPARVQEHRDALKGVCYSAVVDHSHRMGHGVDWFNVKILSCYYNEHNLFYLESLLIVKRKPKLNKRHTSVNINVFT